MTFSYDLSSGTDRDKVRFYTTDTDAKAPIHSDEELDALVTLTGSWQKATKAALRSIVQKLARAGKTKLDWLEVDPVSGLAHFRAMLADFEADFADDLTDANEYMYQAGAVFPTREDTDIEESSL